MKIKIEAETRCLDCKRIDVKYYAKGMCYNCYIRNYYRDRARKRREETARISEKKG